jgi:hypothetical protein
MFKNLWWKQKLNLTFLETEPQIKYKSNKNMLLIQFL